MNLLFMISSDIKKRLVKILSADVFKVIIKPKRRGYFPFRMLLNEINVNICQHESRDKKKNGRDQNESLMPQVARAEEVMPVKTPGDPKIYKQQCIMDGHININVSSVWGRTAEHADISPVDLFEQVAEKKQPYDQKRRIEQQIIGVNQPDRKMNIIVFGKKCGNLFVFCFFVSHNNPTVCNGLCKLYNTNDFACQLKVAKFVNFTTTGCNSS